MIEPDKTSKEIMEESMQNQFIKIGDRLGDGDAEGSERAWLRREYARLSKRLVPEIKEAHDRNKQAKRDHINEQMTKLIAIKKCICGGSLKQSRSGSKICYCQLCNKRYTAVK